MPDVILDSSVQVGDSYLERSVVSPGERGDTRSGSNVGASPVNTENERVDESYLVERRKIIEGMCLGCGEGYCFPRLILEHGLNREDVQGLECTAGEGCAVRKVLFDSKFSNFYLTQIECINILKWEKSQFAGENIGMKIAEEIWCMDGYARAFRTAYKIGLDSAEVYRRVKGEMFATEWAQA